MRRQREADSWTLLLPSQGRCGDEGEPVSTAPSQGPARSKCLMNSSQQCPALEESPGLPEASLTGLGELPLFDRTRGCGISPQGRGFSPLTSMEKETHKPENNLVSISYVPGAKS